MATADARAAFVAGQLAARRMVPAAAAAGVFDLSNSESPELVGRAVAALAAEPDAGALHPLAPALRSASAQPARAARSPSHTPRDRAVVVPVIHRAPASLSLRAAASSDTFAGVNTDPHANLRDRVLRRVLEGPGESRPAIRRAAADGTGLPADLQALVDKIHAHAYRVTDDDVVNLRSAYSDDELFEIVVSAALGASRQRLLAGLRALDLG